MLQFDEILHIYTRPDGTVVPNVTSILQEMGLSPDYKGVDPKVLEEAAEYGTKKHAAFEKFIKSGGLDDSGDPDVKWFAKNIYPDGTDYESELIIETTGLPVNYGGKLDYVRKKPNGRYEITDIKSTATIHYDPIVWQLSMYRLGWCEKRNIPIDMVDLSCLHIPKKGKRRLIEMGERPVKEIVNLMSCYKEGIPYIPMVLVSSDQETKVLALEKQIADLKKKEDEATASYKKLKQEILTIMKSNGVTKWESKGLHLTAVADTTETRINSDVVKAKYQAVVDDPTCWNVNPKKGYLKITIKDNP